MAMSEQMIINLHTAQDLMPVLNVSESAARRLQSMMAERQISGHALRVFVSGGGCSGMQYGMTFDDEMRPGDAEWESFGLRVRIDPISAGYLQGATIAYQQDNMLAGSFKIDNPNAAASCGCGHSFRSRGTPAADADGYDDAPSGGCGCGR